MANLDDIVTVQKNGVIAVNSLVQTLTQFKELYGNFVGTNSLTGISTDSLVYTGSGRIVILSVIVPGSGGTIHDSTTVNDANNSNAICAIPDVVGIYAVNFPFTNGLVVKPASASIVSITYSEN